MKKTTLKYIFTACFVTVLTLSAQLQAQVPVIEVRSGNQGGDHSSTMGAVSSQSELIQLVLSLQEEVRYLRGELETTQHRLNRVESDLVDRYRDVDRRLSVLMQAAMESDPLSTYSAPPEAEVLDSTSVIDGTQSTNQTESSSVSDQNAYDEAFALVRERDFDAAIVAFESFVQRFPDHTNTANGYYWLGELFLAKDLLEQSKKSFETVLERFPNHHKVPDTLYKLGVTYSRLGKHEQSAAMMGRVMSEFPQSTAATLAQSFRPTRR